LERLRELRLELLPVLLMMGIRLLLLTTAYGNNASTFSTYAAPSTAAGNKCVIMPTISTYAYGNDTGNVWNNAFSSAAAAKCSRECEPFNALSIGGRDYANAAPSTANGNLIKLVLPGMMLFLLGIIILLILVQLML